MIHIYFLILVACVSISLRRMFFIEQSFGPTLGGYALMFSLLFPQIFFTCISWCISQRLFSSGRKNLGCFSGNGGFGKDSERGFSRRSIRSDLYFHFVGLVFVWVAAAAAVALVLFNIHCRFRSVSVYR